MRRTILCLVSALLLAPAWQTAAPAQTATQSPQVLSAGAGVERTNPDHRL